MLKFCVLGGGISYTLSPLIHKTVFRICGINADYAVEDIDSNSLDGSIGRLKETYDGFNVTKPHKAAIIRYLSSKETPLNAVNVVKRTGGDLTGYNTDLGGFINDLTARFGKIGGKDTLVLGAGGAAEAVVCALEKEGAKVTVYNRTYDKARALAERRGGVAAESLTGLRPELLVNCKSVGNNGENALPSELDIGGLRFAYDLVYSPRHTAFMKECERTGAVTANGLGMLIRQAILADEIFLGRKLDENALAVQLEKTLNEELK